MTGGLAWVYDEDGEFLARGAITSAFLQPDTWDQLDDAARESIRELVALHASKTASTRAQWLLVELEERRRRNSSASRQSLRPDVIPLWRRLDTD